LKKNSFPYQILKGNKEERFQKAIEIINGL